jgi:cytidine deaminase
MDHDQLIARARVAMERAYAPYSGFRVGAALWGEDGSIHTGCNVENASYGLTICAERAAISGAIAHGVRRFLGVAIASSGPEAVPPCGACRQVLAEFSDDMTIVSVAGGDRKRWTLRQLLPEPFEPRSDVLGERT